MMALRNGRCLRKRRALAWSASVVVSVILMSVVAGVAQVLNRLDGNQFDDADQRLFEVRLLFCMVCVGAACVCEQVVCVS